MKKPLKILLAIALVIVCVFVLLKLVSRNSSRRPADLAPQIAAVTLYDIQGRSANAKALASATSVEFPAEIFQSACSTATNEPGVAEWKGSSLAVLTLKDGTQRQARFSYYGGFFEIDGISGHFVVPEGANSEFQRWHDRLIQEEFIPRRRQRK